MNGRVDSEVCREEEEGDAQCSTYTSSAIRNRVGRRAHWLRVRSMRIVSSCLLVMFIYLKEESRSERRRRKTVGRWDEAMWRRDELWIEVAEGSGPVWAERALFSLFLNDDDRRSTLCDHHTSRLEDARAGQDAANTLTLSFSQLGSTMLVPGLLVVVSLRTVRYRPQLLRVVLRTGLWKVFTTSTRPLSMVHLCCMRLMVNGLST